MVTSPTNSIIFSLPPPRNPKFISSCSPFLLPQTPGNHDSTSTMTLLPINLHTPIIYVTFRVWLHWRSIMFSRLVHMVRYQNLILFFLPFLHFSPISDSKILSPDAIRPPHPSHPFCLLPPCVFSLRTLPIARTYVASTASPVPSSPYPLTWAPEGSRQVLPGLVKALLPKQGRAWFFTSLYHQLSLVKVRKLRAWLWSRTGHVKLYLLATCIHVINSKTCDFTKPLNVPISLSEGQKCVLSLFVGSFPVRDGERAVRCLNHNGL